MPTAGRDGLLRRRDGALVRLLHHGDEPVLARGWPTSAGVRLRAEAATKDTAGYGIERMRFLLALDHDLAPFHQEFRRDPLIGPVIRRRPWLRVGRRAEPFEALAFAVCEQLIHAHHAAEIQRRIVRRFGRRSVCGAYRDAPAPAAVAVRSPAELQACDLSAGRSIALRRAAHEVAKGRVDLEHHESAWRRLRTIPGIGSWTTEKLASEGQGRDDQIPAGDLAYIKLVGRLAGLGRRATEDEVRDFFAPYEPYGALAGRYALEASALSRPRWGPVPAAARW
jgi:3-methyladenine DNA glycosylase/8-oxoguanine DNA glycosylase